jgi:hypothetical protein
MTALYSGNEDTLTSRNIVASYMYAYQAIHDTHPQCEHLEGRWFLVEGVRRDRHWLVLEVERLRQEALSAALDEDRHSSTSHIFKVIRRLSRI